MPVDHHVLIRFNLVATKETCLSAAGTCELSEDVIKRAEDSGEEEARKIIYAAILDKICALKDVINLSVGRVLIFSARWCENASTVAADKGLAAASGVSHKIEMNMEDSEAVETYFSHSAHLSLVAQFEMLAGREKSIFLPGGFAIPFDTMRPPTPRAVREKAAGGAFPFDDPVKTAKWALNFAGQYRDGVPRRDDLVALAGDLEADLPLHAAAIRSTIG